MNERFLVLKAKNGNQEALEELIKLNYQSIYKYFVRTCGNSATALDLTQDTFIKLVQALPNYQPYKDFLCIPLYHCIPCRHRLFKEEKRNTVRK